MLILSFCFSLPASAQSANRKSPPVAPAAHDSTNQDSMRGKGSDLSILTHDASGRRGIAIPLEIKLIRSNRVSIKSINVLGLPQGVTISDSVNVFSSSNDKTDADISDWDLSKIQLMQNEAHASTFSLVVAASWTLERSEQINVATSLITIDFDPDTPDRTGVASRGGAHGPEQPLARPPQPASGNQAVATRDTPTSDVTVPEVNVAPLGTNADAGGPAPSTIPPREPSVDAEAKDPPRAVAAAQPAIPLKELGVAVAAKDAARDMATPQPTTQPDPLVERAKGLIRLGDISGARLLLERAQARNAANATFLLAQTWDPDMLRAWKVRGLRADTERARSLYAKAAGQVQPDGRQLTATGR